MRVLPKRLFTPLSTDKLELPVREHFTTKLLEPSAGYWYKLGEYVLVSILDNKKGLLK